MGSNCCVHDSDGCKNKSNFELFLIILVIVIIISLFTFPQLFWIFFIALLIFSWVNQAEENQKNKYINNPNYYTF